MKNIIDRRLIGREHQYIQEVLNEEFRTSSGATMMKRLEAAFADCFESKYAISFVNGTATMHAALEAMDIGPATRYSASIDNGGDKLCGPSNWCYSCLR